MLPRIFRTGSFRLAASYLGLFTCSVLLLGALQYFALRRETQRDIEQRIDAEIALVQSEFASKGARELARIVATRDESSGVFAYGLISRDGELVAGSLDPEKAEGEATASDWGRFPEVWPNQPGKPFRRWIYGHATRLADGSTLIVGDDWLSVDNAGERVLSAFGWTIGLTLALGAAGGLWLSRHALRRIDSISAAARAIVGGDWRRRLPLDGANDELADLARTFNGLFDRIEQLLLVNKHAGEAIAHDLRKPLARALRRLESLETADASHREEILSDAQADIFGILKTFNALLRIGQLEGKSRRAAFRRISLADVARQVCEDFAPAAEDERKTIACEFPHDLQIVGDPDLLTQMFANCLDNALRYTPPGAKIVVEGHDEQGALKVAVGDDGPGLTEAERARIFERFYRSDAARSTPGAGLGLSLVAAIADLHGMEARALDNGPGLKIEFSAPR